MWEVERTRRRAHLGEEEKKRKKERKKKINEGEERHQTLPILSQDPSFPSQYPS